MGYSKTTDIALVIDTFSHRKLRSLLPKGDDAPSRVQPYTLGLEIVT
ncbi:uncharacterized protein METZ01_LOCUS171368 [marine metagenome]|uniref:Uncharacterized protein n=1 Tax=marine metagenome TaxID=408172 RepID=A0A382BY27_9ZZZZ